MARSSTFNPVLLLHTVLMPVNLWRLAVILHLKAHVRGSHGGDAIFASLLPLATRLTVKKGAVVIRKGDSSNRVFECGLWVAEAEVELGPGSVVDEIDVLSDTHVRTATVTAPARKQRARARIGAGFRPRLSH